MSQEELLKQVWEALAKEPRGVLLSAAKRNHNTALQIRDLIEGLAARAMGPSERGELAYYVEDAQCAEAEARTVLDELRAAFNDMRPREEGS